MPKSAKGQKPKGTSTSNAKVSKKNGKVETEERSVVYDKVAVELFDDSNPLTIEVAKYLLDWKELESKEGAQFKDEYGRYIHCANNCSNRPMVMNDVRSLMSEILNGNFHLNGESGIIGRTGIVLSFQHRLIALVLAGQRWEIDKELNAREAKELGSKKVKDSWPYWSKEPYITTVLVTGVSEDDAVVNTLDTGKPRTLWMAIYRCEELKALEPKHRRVCSRMLEYAITFLRARTGAGLGAFSKKASHLDCMDFWYRHPTLMKAVKHVFEENEEGRVTKLLSPGYMSALLYLMASSGTPESEGEEEGYHTAFERGEKLIDLARFDQACDFVTHISGSEEGHWPVVRTAMAKMQNQAYGINNSERIAILINAWNAFITGNQITLAELELEEKTFKGGKMLCLTASTIDENNACRILLEADHPTLGGIDLGYPKALDEARIVEVAPGIKDPTKEEIEHRKKAVTKAKLKPSKKGDTWDVGDVAWVLDTGDDEAYLGTISEILVCDDDTTMVSVVDVKDKTWDVNMSCLSLEEPTVVVKTSPKLPKTPAPEKTKKAGDDKPVVGQAYWTEHKDHGVYRGKLESIEGKAGKLRVLTGFQGTNNLRTVALSSLKKDQPTPSRA